MTIAAIVQPNYIPWKGYFDLIASVDVFVILDNVQYTRRDWRNRNKIKTQHGLSWLTIPVETRGNFLEPINSIRVTDRSWAMTHWKTIQQVYARAAYFDQMTTRFARWYKTVSEFEYLVDVNDLFLREVMSILGIDTKIVYASHLRVDGDKNTRLIEICKAVGATHYISGPAARAYLDQEAFYAHGISVSWKSYSDYPEYPQLYGAFTHEVSIVDLVLNVGEDSPRFFRRRVPCETLSA